MDPFIPIVGREPLGYVADFCAFCNLIQAHQVRRVALRNYLLFIPTSWGETRGFERRCEKCRVVTTAQPGLYRSFERSPQIELDDLISRTYPNCRTVFAQALADSRALERGRSIPSAQRQAYVLQRLALLDDRVAARCATAHIDKICGIAIVVAIATAIGIRIASNSASLPIEDRLNTPVWVFVAPFALPWACILTDVRRFLARTIYPDLARSIAALDPPVDELAEALKTAQFRGWSIGNRLNPRTLRRYIDAARNAARIERNMR